MKIDIDTLIDGLKGSVRTEHGDSGLLSTKTVKAIALAITVSMTGCASPAFDQAQKSVNSSYGTVEVKEVTEENYRTIINEKVSGIYKHPLYEGKLSTYHFRNDTSAEQEIKADLRELGLSESNFDYNYSILKLVEGNSGTSRHIQDPIGIYEDINYSFINKDASEKIEGKIVTFDEHAIQEDLVYFVMMHEAGHSVTEQQMSIFDFAKIPFSRSQFIYMENSSDAIGLIKTIQMMHNSGRDIEHIDRVIDNIFKSRETINGMNKSEERLPVSEFDVIHRTVPTLRVVQMMYSENPKSIINMSNSEVLAVAEIVANTVMDHDFKSDYINEVTSREQSSYNTLESELELGIITESFLKYLDKNNNNDNNIDFTQQLQSNAEILKKISEKKNESFVIDIANEIASNPIKYYELSKEDINEASRQILNSVIDEISIQNLSQNRLASYTTEPIELYKKVSNQIETHGILNLLNKNSDLTSQRLDNNY
ncbi:hypothetical protein AB6D11_06260 [Vibrio splendidus]